MVDINNKLYALNRAQEERHTQESAEKFGVPYIDLSNYPIVPEVLFIIPQETSLQYQIIAYLKIGSNIKIGMTNPADENAKKLLDDLSHKTKYIFQPVMISKSSFIFGYMNYEKKKKEEEAKLQQQNQENEESFESKITDLSSAAEVAKNVSVTELLDVIIMGSIKTNASDIHLEPGEEKYTVRYRIDGVLQDVVRLPASQYGSLVSRIKYLSHLRMDLNNQPQDGRFSFKTSEENIDLRISLMPSTYGETIVMRLLRQNAQRASLEAMGFRAEALSVIHSAMSRPHGVILTSGPTGSGKTSTLYAILTELNKPERKIITLEDPIEYKIAGIEQSQIDKENSYTFADGLRASLRQDPDIIMVGEIRDTETAEIAIQAGLTGHLVLSTVHANSAPSVFTRLLDIGVKPFLMSGSINLVMAQRLIRKLCPACGEQYTPDNDVWDEIKNSLEKIRSSLPSEVAEKLTDAPQQLMRSKGCEKCHNSGFSGRLALIEVLVPDDNIEALIRKVEGITEFEKAARDQGMITMEQDGLIKVLCGETTVDEVWRVTKD
ncbi:MAG: Type II secretion system protein E [bacterium ADurb.Bin212]|nr:MAG: Type II secretion system protein E [bacterium ADurb.Bin212]